MIGKNLRVLMAEREMNIQDVATETKLSRTTISNLINGYSKGIQFETLEKLSAILKCEPVDFFRR